MDEIIKTGRARERRMEIVVGLILVVGGLALSLGIHALTDGVSRWPSYGAVGLGIAILGHGLFGGS